MPLVSREKDGMYLHLMAVANDQIDGFPNAACINRTNTSLVLLFVGTEWYWAADARAWDCFFGNAACHSASCLGLSSLTTTQPLYATINFSSERCAKHPALHRSEIESSESGRFVSMYATRGVDKFGKYKDPTLFAWIHAPLGNCTLIVSGWMLYTIRLSENCVGGSHVCTCVRWRSWRWL